MESSGESDDETIEYSIELVESSSSTSLVSSLANDNLSHSSSLSSINQDQQQQQQQQQQSEADATQQQPDETSGKTRLEEDFDELLAYPIESNSPLEEEELDTPGGQVREEAQVAGPVADDEIQVERTEERPQQAPAEPGPDSAPTDGDSATSITTDLPDVELAEDFVEIHLEKLEPPSAEIVPVEAPRLEPESQNQEAQPSGVSPVACGAQLAAIHVEEPEIPPNPSASDSAKPSSGAQENESQVDNDLNNTGLGDALVVQLADLPVAEAPACDKKEENETEASRDSGDVSDEPVVCGCAGAGQPQQELTGDAPAAAGSPMETTAITEIESSVAREAGGLVCAITTEQQLQEEPAADELPSKPVEVFEDSLEDLSPGQVEPASELTNAQSDQPPAAEQVASDSNESENQKFTCELSPIEVCPQHTTDQLPVSQGESISPSEQQQQQRQQNLELPQELAPDEVSQRVVDDEPDAAAAIPTGETQQQQQQLTPIEENPTPFTQITGAGDEESPHLDERQPVGQAACLVHLETPPRSPSPARASSPTHHHQVSIPDFNEDLEYEFDHEPTFERRRVEVKRAVNPRSRYSLHDELGRGKFGTVYRCTEQATGRSFAAKFVHMRRQEDREDVNREIEIMSALQHKRLLQLFDAFDDGHSEMCLITELVEGGELFERIVNDDFDLTEKKAAIFMRQICEGVAYMHGLNIVHLDMKPENILCVSRTGNRIKLIDFGLARRLTDAKPLRVMFGTPDFAAPEVLAYDTVSLATDMWSVGVICYVLLSGLSPFMGDSDMDTMANVTRAAYDFNDEAFEPISDLAKDFIARLLVKEQAKRLTPTECLQHPWLQRGGAQLEASVRERRCSVAPSAPLDSAADWVQLGAAVAQAQVQVADFDRRPSLDKRNLKKYVVRRKWHKTVHAIMALQRMGAHLTLN